MIIDLKNKVVVRPVLEMVLERLLLKNLPKIKARYIGSSTKRKEKDVSDFSEKLIFISTVDMFF